MARARLVRGLILAVVWLVVALATGLAIFLNSSRTVVLASHDAVLRPTLDGHVVLHTGPVLPDLRMGSGERIGVDVSLGKTNSGTTDELVERYAVIASQPDGQIEKVEGALLDMAYGAGLRGAVLGLLPVLVWLLIGPARRRELLSRPRVRTGAAAGLALVLVGVLLWAPRGGDEDIIDEEGEWTTLTDFLGPGVPLPDEVRAVEVRSDVTTFGSRRLVQSAVDTYEKSRTFYNAAAVESADLELRQPEQGETVVVLISDRHDNIGMDKVARAIADAGGATAVFDAGDDTSAGQSWEAFSLDSVTEAFGDLDRYGVTGNHDHGEFVGDYLGDHGWTMLDGDVIEGPGGATLLGVGDPRSSGLGSWRDESGLSFEEVEARLTTAACGADQRIATILVHDAAMASDALDRGCVDLVVGGHLHAQVGPTRIVGEGDRAGYSFTTGTTGGAAYAFALGSKPRRLAEVTLLTYLDGRPAGIQPVQVQTSGVVRAGDFTPLQLTEEADAAPLREPPR